MNLQALLQNQAVLFAVLGAMVFIANYTARHAVRREKQDTSVQWFLAACLCGAVGLGLEAERGHLSPLLTIVGGNLLVLLVTILLTRAIAIATNASSRAIPFLLVLTLATISALSYYALVTPDAPRRVLIACVGMSILLTPATVMLFQAKEKTIQVATRTLGILFLCFIGTCLLQIIAIFRGAHPSSGANLGGTILIAGTALSFLWIDVARTRSELEHQAMTDPLTGLLNRRSIEALASRELDRAARHGNEIAVLTIDVDRFKDINDRLGHAAGDTALLGIARTLSRMIRSTDLAARTGGDEFLLILPDASQTVVHGIEQRIHEGIKALDLRTPHGDSFEISITIGASRSVPKPGQSYAGLVHESDMDLYLRKRGRQSPVRSDLMDLAEELVLVTDRA